MPLVAVVKMGKDLGSMARMGLGHLVERKGIEERSRRGVSIM